MDTGLFTGSWKTTWAGYITLIIAILSATRDFMDGMNPDVDSIIAAFVAVGLINARDNNKSSEEVGAK
jgi:hypothetical protein